MGNCKIDFIVDRTESQKEVKLYDNDSNNKDKKKEKYYDIDKIMNDCNENVGKKVMNLNINNDKLVKDKSSSNDDELIIITPRLNNNKGVESYINEITDDFTIKNETLVYINEHTMSKNSEINDNLEINKIIKNEKNKNKKNPKSRSGKSSKIIKGKINKSENNIIKNKNIKKNICKRNQNLSKKHNQNMNDNTKIAKGRIIQKNNNFNPLDQDIPLIKMNDMDINQINNIIDKSNQNSQLINNLKQSQGNYLNKRKAKSKKNSQVFNKSYNIYSSNYLNPLFESFQFSDIRKGNNNPQSSTLEKQNLELEKLLIQNLPMINSEEILPNIEKKTYKEDLDSPNGTNKIKRENEFKNKKMNIPIFKKKTDFHIRNKSYNKFNFFNNNITNDNFNDNNYFSLFNNNANLSINFIHNKFNKSSQHMKQIEPMMNNNEILSERHNKSSCNKKVSMKNDLEKKDNKKLNPFFNYNNFNNKNGNIKKKSKNKSGNLPKIKNGLPNSKSYNNIYKAIKKDNNKFNNTNLNTNNFVLPVEQNSDMIEVYLPKTHKPTLICEEIINKEGNKYFFSYEKLDMFDTEQILYDGVVYKVINNIENGETEYKFLERYFQITKNCFKYFNNIKEALKQQEKPLVQFDIRHIKTIEIIENSFLKGFKINGNKNINILFCIYIKGNNDFFVFAHYNKYVGHNIINILQLLIRYYEDS